MSFPPDRTDLNARTGWRVWQVAGYRCDVYEPPQVNEHGFTLIYLHDQPDRQAGLEIASPPFERLFERHGLRVIAPYGGNGWWSNRETSHFPSPGGVVVQTPNTAERLVVERLLPAMADAFDVRPPQIGLFGIGMGGQGALRIAYRHPNAYPVVAGIGADLDFHFRIKEGNEVLFDIYGDTESARQDTAILQIHPLNWPRHQYFCASPEDGRVFDGADRLRMKLSSIGIPFESDLETTASRKVAYAEQMAVPVIDFLVTRLGKERLRIV